MVAAGVRRRTTRPTRGQTAPMAPVELAWGDRQHHRVDGVDIHVELAGPEDAATVACLHGFASGTFTWAGIAPILRDELRVLAWDRPPFGRSERLQPVRGTRDPYRLEAELARTATLLATTSDPDRPCVLVGHSAGSLLALQIALARTTRVDGLVLIAPAVDGGPPPAVRAAARVPGSGLVAASVLRVGMLGASTVLRRSTRHGTPLTEATAMETGRTLRRSGTAAALWHLTSTWEPPAVVGRLAEVDVPAIVIGGLDDRIVSVDQHRTAAEGLGAELHLVDGAGHAPHEQRPDLVAGLIRDFVRTL